MAKQIDIKSELESEEYKEQYSKFMEITNSLLRCLVFTSMNCSRNKEMSDKHFFLFIIDDILQSTAAIKILAEEGMRNSCRRELRYLIELSLTGCFISQKLSSKPVKEQVGEYENFLKDTNISKIKDIHFQLFEEDIRDKFIAEVKRMYGYTCNYVHASRSQIEERIRLFSEGRTIGFEGTKELKELNNEIAAVYSFVLVFLFHSVPSWNAGDYLVESNGESNCWFFKKSKYIAAIDAYYDYKHERKAIMEKILKDRENAIEF